MKTMYYILAVIAMLFSSSCTTPQIDDNNQNSNSGEVAPLLSIEYPSVRSTLQLPIYSYGPSTLLIRARNVDDNSEHFVGVSLDENRVAWELPLLYSDHFWKGAGYIHDNLFVVMSTNEKFDDPNSATLYCFNLDTQAIVWSKDFWQYPRSWCGVVGIDGYSYHYENRIDDSLLIKTDVLTGESTVLYQTPTYYAPTGTNPTIATYGGNQYIIFYMWDLRKTTVEQNVVVSVYNITKDELTYQDYLPSIQVAGICISQPKDDVVYINHGHILHCFNYVEKKIVWSRSGFDYDLLSELILLDNGDVLRVAHAEMSYVDGNSGNVRWEKRYDETYDDYDGEFDFMPSWTFVHNNRIYQTYNSRIIEVRDLMSGAYLSKITCKKNQTYDITVGPLKAEDGFYVSTHNEILKYPYVND